MTKGFAVALTILLAVSAAAAQTASTPSAPAQQPAAATPAPETPRPPQAKSQAEHTEYIAALQNPDLAAGEAAADAFSTKYPDSELTGYLFAGLQQRYQAANNSDKTIELGRKALKVMPDHAMALVSTALVIAERTRDSDLDRDERYAESIKYSQHALESVDKFLAAFPNLPPEQLQRNKSTLRSMAFEAQGIVNLSRKDYKTAEENLLQAVEASPDSAGPYVYYRLSLALDYQKKYSEALKAVNRCLELAQAGDPVIGLAKQEQSRLSKLVGAPPPAAQPTPQTPPPSGK
jgi:tetratricopeptide (TPR) repeat protein